MNDIVKQKQQQEYSRLLSIVLDNVDNLIQFGEYAPKDCVLDQVIEALVEIWGKNDVWDDAMEDEDILPGLSADLLGADRAEKDRIAKEFRIRVEKRYRKLAELKLTDFEPEAWEEWKARAVPFRQY